MATFVTMKPFRSLLLIIAALLFLGHNVVPHKHHEAAVVCEEERDASDLLDLLSVFFHPDLGLDHLQSYQQDNSQNWLAVELPTATILPVPPAVCAVEPTDGDLIFPPSATCLSSWSLRGPPVEM